jgi:hypothetical protein
LRPSPKAPAWFIMHAGSRGEHVIAKGNAADRMHREVGLLKPLSVCVAYYAALYGLSLGLIYVFPDLVPSLPLGAIDDAGFSDAEFSEVVLSGRTQALSNITTLLLAIVAAVALMVPISWVYFLTHPLKEIQSSFVHTTIILPIVVAGIAMVVQHSIPLAFSLAGIVAAVRFRFSLAKPAHAVYVFTAITVGLSAGVSALEVAVVVSMFFVLVTMLLWKLDYGERMGGRFITFFTGRSDE